MKSTAPAFLSFSTSLSHLNDESKLSFAAAAACIALGLPAWALARLLPDDWHLEALLVIGVFYLVLGLNSVRKRDSLESPQKALTADRIVASPTSHQSLQEEEASLQGVA